MSRSYRGIIVAAVGFLILANAHQPEAKAGKPNAARNTQPADAPAPPYKPYPSPNAPACYQAPNHDTADLCAQWRATLAAEKAAHEARRATGWAIVATILSAIGVGGLILTILQTWGALGEARKGNRIAMKANAKATLRAIKGAEETAAALEHSRANAAATNALVQTTDANARRQIRAYLAISRIKLEIFEGSMICCNVTLSNQGQTRARISAINYKVWVGPFPDLSPQEKVSDLKNYPHIHPFLNGKTDERLNWFGETSQSEVDFIKSIKVLKETKNPKALYICGFVKYKDVFEAEQRLEFSYRNDGPITGENTGFVALPTGNDAT